MLNKSLPEIEALTGHVTDRGYGNSGPQNHDVRTGRTGWKTDHYTAMLSKTYRGTMESRRHSRLAGS